MSDSRDVAGQDFNWVEARGKWSPEEVFRVLLPQVTLDVTVANELQLRNRRFECVPLSTMRLNVVRFQNYGGFEQPTRTVLFELATDGIRVEVRDYAQITHEFTAVPILSPEGVRVLQVGKSELGLWQFRRLALEPLFFPAEGA